MLKIFFQNFYKTYFVNYIFSPPKKENNIKNNINMCSRAHVHTQTLRQHNGVNHLSSLG